ncbi:hypothetical protein CASFOL_027851 [Castilleja foliolosa]|uniref:F-box domain-containing protein n=1 Tax=Castilleja foliolosa TaxID=1961234 RepID=A0ABD3CFY9_9LAMI
MRIKKKPTISNALASSVLPEDVIMHCILTRLPVKSILRCKSVCKPWLKFLSSPEFIQLHYAQFSSVPKNQSFIVQRTNCSWSDRNTISLFSIESGDKNPTILDHPLDRYSVDIVGCCNGLVCLKAQASNSDGFVLWNPALKLFKEVFLNPPGVDERLSLGFGYVAEADDYKVVSIVCLNYPGNVERLMKVMGIEVSMKVIRVEVYSVNSDSWTIIDPGFRFNVFRVKSDVSVNGNPYWLAMFDEDKVLVCFDVSKSVFKVLPMETLDLEADMNVKLVDWSGRLGALCCTGEKEGVIKSLDAWVFDENEQIWIKTYTIKPVEMSVDMFLQFTKKGGILGVRRVGEVFVLNPESGCVEGFFYGARKGESFEVYECTESLVYIEGMRQACVTRKMIDSASYNGKRKSSEVLDKQEFWWRRLIRERR